MLYGSNLSLCALISHTRGATNVGLSGTGVTFQKSQISAWSLEGITTDAFL